MIISKAQISKADEREKSSLNWKEKVCYIPRSLKTGRQEKILCKPYLARHQAGSVGRACDLITG